MNYTVQLVDEYIARCDKFTEVDGSQETIARRKQFISEVVSTFRNDIPHITTGLTMYPGIYYGQVISSKYEFTEDIVNLKSKLIRFRCDLLDSQSEMSTSCMDLIPSVNNISISNNVQVQIDVYQALKSLDVLELDSEIKQELRNILFDLDEARKTENANTFKTRLVIAARKILDKSADAFISILPYLAGLV